MNHGLKVLRKMSKARVFSARHTNAAHLLQQPERQVVTKRRPYLGRQAAGPSKGGQRGKKLLHPLVATFWAQNEPTSQSSRCCHRASWDEGQ